MVVARQVVALVGPYHRHTAESLSRHRRQLAWGAAARRRPLGGGYFIKYLLLESVTSGSFLSGFEGGSQRLTIRLCFFGLSIIKCMSEGDICPFIITENKFSFLVQKILRCRYSRQN